MFLQTTSPGHPPAPTPVIKDHQCALTGAQGSHFSLLSESQEENKI